MIQCRPLVCSSFLIVSTALHLFRLKHWDDTRPLDKRDPGLLCLSFYILNEFQPDFVAAILDFFLFELFNVN